MPLTMFSRLLIYNRRQITLIGMIALFLVTAWLYFPPYSGSFIGDDYVQQWRIREFLDSPIEAYRIFNPYWTNWYYRPLQNLWFLGNRLFFGLTPTGYYYLQITGHFLAIALIFQISRRLRVGAYATLAAAAFFAISGQHQMVVGWISSIGNIVSAACSLAAIAAYISYLQRPNRAFSLLITLLFYFCALFAHEEGFILPIFLLVVRLLWPSKPPLRRAEILTGLITLVSMVAYASLQIVRPNANLTLEGAFPKTLLSALLPINSGRFLVDVGIRWLPFGETSGIMESVRRISEFPLIAILVTVLILILFFYAIFKGSLAIRLGLIWTSLHLAFIYTILWGQRPELFDSRHIYSAWAGVSIAFGGVLYSLYEFQKNDRRFWRLTPSTLLIFIGGLFFFTLWFQAELTRQVQQGLLAHAQLVEKSKNQLMTLLPEINDSTRLFANRFVLSAPYFIPAARVWYGEPELVGGTLESLKKYEEVSSNFYLFDYADASFYNLLPELQEHRRTILLWRHSPVQTEWLYDNGRRMPLAPEDVQFDIVVGPPNDRRLSIKVASRADAWASFVYEIMVPAGGQLATEILPEDGHMYRIVATDQDGARNVVFSKTWGSAFDLEWQDIQLPLGDYTGHTIKLSFDYRGSSENQNPGYWSNPRFVLD